MGCRAASVAPVGELQPALAKEGAQRRGRTEDATNSVTLDGAASQGDGRSHAMVGQYGGISIHVQIPDDLYCISRKSLEPARSEIRADGQQTYMLT